MKFCNDLLDQSGFSRIQISGHLENMNAEYNFCNKSFLFGIGYWIHFNVEFKGL